MNGPSGRDRAGEITPTTKRYDISQHPCHQQHHHTRVAITPGWRFLSCTGFVYYIVLNVIRRGTNWRMGKVCSNVFTNTMQTKRKQGKHIYTNDFFCWTVFSARLGGGGRCALMSQNTKHKQSTRQTQAHSNTDTILWLKSVRCTKIVDDNTTEIQWKYTSLSRKGVVF